MNTARWNALTGLVLAGLAFWAAARGWIPECRFRLLTTVPCPLCGGTRAGLALVHGEVGQALKLNPLAVLLLAGAAAWLGSVLVLGRFPRQRLEGWKLGLFLSAVVAGWLYLVWVSLSAA